MLLTRYAELDPERAIEIARLHAVDDSLLASLHASWAAQNPAGALAALSSVDDPVEATAIGLAMLPPLGGDEHARKQVIAALPIGADYDFQIAAVAAHAAAAPAAALDQALGFSESVLSELALERVGADLGPARRSRRPRPRRFDRRRLPAHELLEWCPARVGEVRRRGRARLPSDVGCRAPTTSRGHERLA